MLLRAWWDIGNKGHINDGSCLLAASRDPLVQKLGIDAKQASIAAGSSHA